MTRKMERLKEESREKIGYTREYHTPEKCMVFTHLRARLRRDVIV